MKSKNKSFLTRTSFLLAALIAFSLLVAGNVGAQVEDGASREAETQSTENQTIYQIIQSDPALESFETWVEAVGLSDNLQQDGPFTIFAPTNEAFAAYNLMAEAQEEEEIVDTMLYHVVNGNYSANQVAGYWALPTLAGENLFFSAATSTNTSLSSDGEQAAAVNLTLNETAHVVRADINASNGVIHIIDAVVEIPEGNSIYASTAGSSIESMAEVLANDGRFNTLLSLAEQAGLMSALESTSSAYTLFAPTDEAFEAVPDKLMEEWLADPEGALNVILSYHVVPDRLSINQIATDDYLPTVEGRPLVVTTDEDIQVYLNGRPIQDFNILASNGLIHVVDEVILP